MSANVYERIAERYQVAPLDDETIERFLLDIAPTLPREEREAILTELKDAEISRRPDLVATDLPLDIPTFSVDDAPPIARPNSLTRLVGELCAAIEMRLTARLDAIVTRVVSQAQGSLSHREVNVARVGDLIEQRPFTMIEPQSTVRAAAQRMLECSVGAVAVVNEDSLVGVFSMNDMSRVIAEGRDPEATSVGSVMSKEIAVAEPNDDVDSALRKMWAVRSGHLPVVEDGKLIGMISLRDLLHLGDDDLPNKASILKELVMYSDYES